MITFLNFQQMFPTVNHFQMLEQGGRRGALQILTENQSKASNFAKRPWPQMTKEDIVHIKTCKATKMNIIQHTAEAF